MKKIDLKDKHIRFGGYSLITATLIIALLVVVNLIFSSADIKWDMTEEKFYSLSEKTTGMIETLEDDIAIYVLEETGKENKDFKDIVEKYEKLSNKIKVEYKDPVLYPTFATSYLESDLTTGEQTLADGSIIVENLTTGKSKVIPQYQLFNVGMGYNGPQIQSVSIEEKITGAIDYVTSKKDHRVFVTTGHNEYPLPSQVITQLEKENVVVQEINLLTEELVASPENTLVIYSPHLDFAETEAEKLLDFLEQGGKAIVFADPDTPELPNFSNILAHYGIGLQTGIVVEGSTEHMVSPYPTFILPEMNAHDITAPIIDSKLPIVMPMASSLTVLEERRHSLEITPLLTTSDEAWLKQDFSDGTIEKSEGDLEGPLTLAYVVEDVNTLDLDNMITTQLIVVANTGLLDSRQINMQATGNLDMIVNSFLWLQDKEESLYIAPKAFTYYGLTIDARTLIILGGVSILLIPIVVIGFGLRMWLRRRNL